MHEAVPLDIHMQELSRICCRFQVRELALFGSMLAGGESAESDIDLLVSFQPGARVTFSTIARMQRELATLLGRNVDLVPRAGLKPAIRDDIVAASRVLYAA